MISYIRLMRWCCSLFFFFFSSRRRHTRLVSDWSSDVCSSDLNTLIIYISGDNGTSPEGTLSGTFNQMTAYNGILDVPEALQLLHYKAWGSDKTDRKSVV